MTSPKKEQSFVERIDPERSNPTRKHTALPNNHPVQFLPEARSYYQSYHVLLPFLLKKRSAVIKTVVLPTRDGSRPKPGKVIEAKIVAKPWDKDFMFWTLDLNDTRHIVKPFPGAPQGGMRYLRWAGPGKNFEQEPIALSFISPSQSGTTSALGIGKQNVWTNASEWLDASDAPASPDTSVSSDTSDSEVEANASGRKASKRPSEFQRDCVKRRKTHVSSEENEELYRATPRAPRRSDGRAPSEDFQPESPQRTTSTSKTPVNDREAKRKGRAIARIEKELDRPFDEIFTPWSSEDRDVSRNTLQTILQVISLMKDNSPQMISRTLNKALNGGDGKRQPAGGRKPTRPYFNGLATSLQSTEPASVDGDRLEIPSSLSQSNRQHLHSRSLQGPEAVSAKTAQPNPRSIPLDANLHQDDRDLRMDISPSMVLSLQKQIRTSLIVRVAPSLEYAPLRLSGCTNPEAFYNKVLGAWEVHRESVAKMTVTFNWMAQEDPMRRMVMNGQMERFAHLLEQVEEAPCWAEAPEGKGKCVLNVEIVLKE